MPADTRGDCRVAGSHPREAGGPGQDPADCWESICIQLLVPGEGDWGSSSRNRGGVPCPDTRLPAIQQRPACPQSARRRRGAGILSFSLRNPGSPHHAETLVWGSLSEVVAGRKFLPRLGPQTTRIGKAVLRGSPGAALAGLPWWPAWRQREDDPPTPACAPALFSP